MLEVVDPVHPIYRAERIPRLVVDAPGDSDGDWDLDLIDAHALQGCYTGPGRGPLAFPCTLSDVDADGDVDCADWDRFSSTWTDAGDPPRFERCGAGLAIPNKSPRS